MKAETAIQPADRLVKAANRVPRWILPAVKAAIFLADAALAAVCFMAAFRWREAEPVFANNSWQFSGEFEPYAAVLILAVPVRLAMLLYQRVYRLQGAFSYTREAIKIFKAVAVGSLLTIAVAFLFRGGFAYRDFSYSRGVFLFDFALALVAFTAFHLVLRRVQALVRRRDINLIPTLILGGGTEAEQTIRELQTRPDLGYRVVGIVRNDEPGTLNDELKSDSAFSVPGSSLNAVPVFAGLSELPNIIRQLAIQEVIITDNNLSHEVLFEAMMKIGRKQRVEFRLAPSVFNLLPNKTEVEQIGVLPIIRLFREPLSDAERFVKRVSDIIISLAALTILAPVWILISILIRLDSKGAILFRQERVGMDGRIFLCFKFRTMRSDADDTIHREAYRKNIAGELDSNHDADEAVFGKVKNDPRITNVGRWLRRSSLDEIPQLLNVLLGDMSIVGARPPIPYEVEEYALWHRRRLDMKPGITGLWQVSGRNRLTFDEMVKLDLFYIENWSLWLDLKIILLTLPAVLRGDGAR
jgi:exopolysaccharide biosynthesis polyprenyl glycosylphosphotransferase